MKKSIKMLIRLSVLIPVFGCCPALAAQEGWLQINGTWYYFYSSGAMAANTTIDGHYINSNGAWIK